MKKVKKSTFYERFYVVEGIGEFPFDMLRYDCSFPASEADARRAQHRASQRRRVALISRRVNDSEPTAARWESFTWGVVEREFYELYDAIKFAAGES